MSLLNAAGAPMTPQITPEQLTQLMTGLRIRIDAANSQLVQLGLLVEYLYENLEKQGMTMPMQEFPTWAEARYKEIQEQAKKAVEEGQGFAKEMQDDITEQIKNAGIDLNDDKATETAETAETAEKTEVEAEE
jgi:hypothetical protein